MQTHVILLVLGLTCWVNSVNGLTCYSCTGYNSGQCFYPNQNETTLCKSHTKSLDSELRSIYGQQYVDNIGRASSEIRCVHYEKRYAADNTTEVFRGCLDAIHADDFCKNHQNNEQFFNYKVTQCRICNEDYCNSSYRVYSSAMSIISFCAIALAITKLYH